MVSISSEWVTSCPVCTSPSAVAENREYGRLVPWTGCRIVRAASARARAPRAAPPLRTSVPGSLPRPRRRALVT